VLEEEDILEKANGRLFSKGFEGRMNNVGEPRMTWDGLGHVFFLGIVFLKKI
jgi:hypothetical protein